MTPTQAENLRILIRHMETKCSRRLDMGMFAEPCGAPACALGEACVVPELQHLGLPDPRCVSIAGFAWQFVEAVGDMVRLFGVSSSNAWRRNNVTPQEWATEARKVLSEHGYSMDDGFAAFKAKILMPLVEGVPAWE